MKYELYIVITDPERFARGDRCACFSLYEDVRYLPKEWTVCGDPITIDVDVDVKVVVEKATAEIDERIGKATALINDLENRKREMLAITHEPDMFNYDGDTKVASGDM